MNKHSLLIQICTKYKANKIKVLDKQYIDRVTTNARHEYIIRLYRELSFKPRKIADIIGLAIGTIYSITCNIPKDSPIDHRDNRVIIELLQQEKISLQEQLEQIEKLIKIYK